MDTAARIIFSDGFQGIPVGMFSADVGPHTEYHYRSEAAPKYGWGVASFFHELGAKRAWFVEEKAGRRVLRQTYENERAFTHPMVTAGDPFWTDYKISTELAVDGVSARAGLAARYETNRKYYFFGLVPSGAALIKVDGEAKYHEPDEEILGRVDFQRKAGAVYRISVSFSGNLIVCEAEELGDATRSLGRLEARNSRYSRGKIGLLSDGPADFLKVEVSAPETAIWNAAALKHGQEKELAGLRAENPAPKLWKKIPTPGFGVGRNLRFGDLDGDGRIEILVPQVIQHGPKDVYAEVGCLTAIDLEGKILWQNGTPDPANWFLTNDVAVQVHDIDGDGQAEVIFCRDLELVILEGKTGKVKRRMPTPESGPNNDRYPRILGDCLFFCDFRGLGRPGDIVLKDRYWGFWVYDQDLNLLWKGNCRTGHYPWAADLDGDGKDELLIGYARYDHDGTLLWNLEDRIADHADGIAAVNFHHPLEKPDRILYAASDDGAFFLDLKGNVLKHYQIGHAQNPAVLKLRDDLPGLQTVTINFWGNQGILHFFDADGNLYHSCEPNNFGSMCLPVNWRGDGREFFLHSTNTVHGGMFDGWGRPVVMFPEDGHPDLCNAVMDLTGDCRDEIITWNQNEIWIYTQDDSPKTGRLYKPTRNPLWNESNYKASVSLPGWTE